MKNLFAALLTCVLTMPAFTQDFPELGRITREEMQMKECSFDKEADAIVLAHEAYADHDDQYRLITNHRVRLKILKEKGLHHADIRIPYYLKDNFERIDEVKGKIYNENGAGGISFQDLEKKSIFKKAVSKYYGEVVFTFPSVKAGSIIEYTYISTMTHYGGLDDWQFQKSLPVVHSKYSVVILPNYEFAYRVQKLDEYPIDIKQEKGTGKITFAMKNIPGLRNEPYMDARKDYVQMVTFQLAGQNIGYKKTYTTNWQEMIRELSQHSNFGNQLGKGLAGTDEFIKMLKLDPSETSRLTKVYNYVRANMGWNGFTSLYASDGIKQPWAKKSGTSGEINLALTSLLREAGIEAYPMLVSEREHGRVDPNVPFLEQFNTVFAYALADGKKYYLDATNKYSPPHIVPYNILNTLALIVNRKAGGLVEIKDDNFEYRDYVNVIGKLSPDGKIAGNVFMTSNDYAKTERLASIRNNSSKYMKRFTGESGNVNVDSFLIINEDIDSLPLVHKFLFSAPVNSTGDYTFLPTNLFSELDGNPFLSTTRFSNVNFGYRQTYITNLYISVPEGITVDAMPKSVKLVNEDKSIIFSRNMAYDEKSRNIIARITVEMKKSLYDSNEYGALYEFYKKMYDLLGEQVVIKKS